MVSNKKLRQRIEAILADKPHCRDNDQSLLVNVWQQEFIEKYGTNTYCQTTIDSAFAEIIKGVLSNPESVRRTRQKVQELQPLLRGQNYRVRQKHEGVVKKEIRAFK